MYLRGEFPGGGQDETEGILLTTAIGPRLGERGRGGEGERGRGGGREGERGRGRKEAREGEREEGGERERGVRQSVNVTVIESGIL